jgi:hypothetical protein
MLERLEEAAATKPIDLDPVDISHCHNLQRIRANPSHALLAYRCDQGLLLRDRHTKLSHLLTWDALQDIIPIGE